MPDCIFQLSENDGYWHCSVCGSTSRKRPNRDKPPRRNCYTSAPGDRKIPLLGDTIKSALGVVGITEERVTGWLGHPCGCAGRRKKLNQLDEWARGAASGAIKDAAGFLVRLITPAEPPEKPSEF